MTESAALARRGDFRKLEARLRGQAARALARYLEGKGSAETWVKRELAWHSAQRLAWAADAAWWQMARDRILQAGK